MASSFMDTIQNLADSISSNKNGFTWDSAIRKFQYGIAGITLAALSIYETTNTMQCSTPTPAYPEFYYASSYCQEATWYIISNVNDTKVPYDEWLRDFKWYILIPPALTIISALLYGALVDSFIIQALKSADQIMNIWNAKMEDRVTVADTTAINNTMLNTAIRARVFSETHMHYRKNKNCYVCCGSKSSKHSINCATSYGEIDNGFHTELYRLDNCSYAGDIMEQPVINKVGHKTALYYQLYLGMCLIINLCAVALLNPYFFWFPNAVACQYRKEDLTLKWSICSLPGHRYSRVAIIIIMLNHGIGVLVTFLSFYYLNSYMPSQIVTANVAISSYTRDPKQQVKILQCWRKYGKDKMKTLTATTKFILALIYQNVDRLLCYRLVLAMIDIEKDKDAINSDLPLLIKQIVDIDVENAGIFDGDRVEIINEIRETIMNPVGIDQVKSNIQSNILMKWVLAFLNNPNSTKELFQCQLIQRITGVQLPKLSKENKDNLCGLINEKKESDFESSVEYNRFLSAIYDLSKSRYFFTLLNPMEIGELSESESPDRITDNGHEVVADQVFDAANAFNSSGYCWRSSDATAYNWIKRTWEKEYTIQLVAIQGSHINEKSTPIHFNFTAKLRNSQNGIDTWEEVSDSYQSYDWLKDEWRVFLLVTTDKVDGSKIHPRTKDLQINIFKNGGAEYFEIQKIKIFGTN